MEIAPNTIFANRYLLIEKKGQGTYGEVWLARDEQLDNMEVAIKIYISLDERGMQEFGTEYRVTYGLNHPNLLHAFHYDVFDSHPYLVMPYCPKSATDYVGHIDETKLWQFIRDVASGLAYLHEKDILHHDIKPDNILEDANGHFVISDFGISVKMRSTLRRNSTRQMVNSNPLAGSIAYMGPEMFASHAESVKATDIWALGATLYELATGELPCYGQGGSILLNGDPVQRPNVPYSDALVDTILDCLAKETWDRPIAQQLVQRAQAALSGRPVETGRRQTPPGFGGSTPGHDMHGTVKQGGRGWQSNGHDMQGTVKQGGRGWPSNENGAGHRSGDMGGTVKEGANGGGTEPEKKKSKAWIWVLLVALLGAGGFGAWKVSDNRAKQADNDLFALCQSTADYRSYLRQYPQGLNADLAKSRIKTLTNDSIVQAKAREEAQLAQVVKEEPKPEPVKETKKPKQETEPKQAKEPKEPKTSIASTSKPSAKVEIDEEELFSKPRQTSKTYPDGSSYSGYALPNGSKEGYGTFTDSHGATYKGNWKNNKRNGTGRQDYTDGSWYDGEWKDDLRSGQGEWKTKEGHNFKGSFSNNKINGEGTMTYAYGEVKTYSGTWKNGQCTGYGTMTLTNGQRLVGDFVNGKLNGNGTIYKANGSIMESGRYVNGVKQDY